MAGIFGYSREAVRVKVKKCEGLLQPEFRKFSVDPQITSFEVLQSILAKAFDIKGEFTICYRTFDDCGHEIHLSILSDWDLDAAFLRAHNTSLTNCSEPSLCLRVDMKPFEETCDEWDVTTNIPATINTRVVPSEIKATQRLPGLIMNQVERTFNMVQRALNLGEDGNVAPQPPRQPLSDSEFRRFLDPVGQIKHAKDLRSVIYYGGIDPSLRKVVWKHILNVYPDGMSGRERMDYMKRKASEYYALRDTWKDLLQRGPVTGDLAYTTGMVRKDVLRTDRHHRFYAGSDDNQNIASLFNILTTYALNHPKVSYCQGMSDLASPLLVTMGDEAHAYICFCALMSRLGHNFMLDGIAMTQKFTHLAEALLFYDPEFYNYLKSHQADDLLFCYRWLLLEMKREFAFDDSLRMLEVLWSSLPATPPSEELKLYETEFKPLPVITPPISPLIKTPRENAYTKVCALRRQSSSMSIASWAAGTTQKSHTPIVKRQNHSLDETLGRTFFKNTLHEAKTFQSLDDTSVTLSSTTETYTEDTGRDTNLKTVSTVDSRSRSTSPSEIKSESNDRFDRQDSMKKLSSSMSNLVNKSTIVKKGHFRDLKERIAAGKRGIFGSTEKLDSADVIKEEQENSERKPKGRMVKNLNEFLSFASNKNRIADNFSNGEIRKNDDKPVITLTGSSFDESVSDSKFSAGSSGRDSFDGSSPDDSQEYFPMTTSMTRELRLELENLDRQVFGSNYRQHGRPSPNESESSGDSSSTVDDDVASCDCLVSKPSSEIADGSTLTEVAEIGSVGRSSRARTEIDEKVDVKKYSDDIFVWENPLHRRSPADRVRSTKYPSTPDEQAEELEYDGESGEIFEETQTQGGIKSVTPIRLVRKSNSIKKEGVKPCKVDVSDSSDSDVQEQVKWKSGLPQERLQNGDIQQMTNSCEEATENAKNSSSSLLPSPQDFGGGNPFLMFLCVTVLLQHRDYVMRNGMDYNEMAMHFDKMVRKHDVTRVLNQARRMFANYMRLHGANNNPATNGGDVDI